MDAEQRHTYDSRFEGVRRESPLPEEDYQRALHTAQECDLMLVLGSSLNITPACQIPSKTVAAGGKLVIVNLQPTQLDKVLCKICLWKQNRCVARHLYHGGTLRSHLHGTWPPIMSVCGPGWSR